MSKSVKLRGTGRITQMGTFFHHQQQSLVWTHQSFSQVAKPTAVNLLKFVGHFINASWSTSLPLVRFFCGWALVGDSCHLHTLATLAQRKEPLLNIELEAWWSTELVLMLWGWGKPVTLCEVKVWSHSLSACSLVTILTGFPVPLYSCNLNWNLLLKENFQFSKAVHKATVGYSPLSTQQGEKEAGRPNSLTGLCVYL